MENKQGCSGHAVVEVLNINIIMGFLGRTLNQVGNNLISHVIVKVWIEKKGAPCASHMVAQNNQRFPFANPSMWRFEIWNYGNVMKFMQMLVNFCGTCVCVAYA
jgi:hypothetical protein